MLGNFHDDIINIECETSSADLYVVDAEGKYIENIAMHSYLESDVIDAINAKYGTNFTQLTMQKVTGIAIGDDCPNWNAYEKIEMPLNLSALILFNKTRYIAIDVINGDSGTIMCDYDMLMLINESKVFVGSGPPFEDGEEIAKEFILSRYGVNITNWSANNQSIETGSTIPNSEKYIIMN